MEEANCNNFDIPFITSYSTQHYTIKCIIRKHWHILLNDSVLAPLLPPTPQIVYRGASSIKDKLVQSVLDPLSIASLFHNLVGYFKCGKCCVCRCNSHENRKIQKFTSSVWGRTYTIKPFITCSTTHIVYCLQCPCGLQYVGRTTRALNIRLNEHISNIMKGGLCMARRGCRVVSSCLLRQLHAGQPETACAKSGRLRDYGTPRKRARE